MNQYRSKGSIGFIAAPRCNETNLEEAFRLRPPGLTWCFASLGMSNFGPDDYDRALANMEDAAKELALRKVSVIVPSGLPLQAHRGPDFYWQLESIIQGVVGPDIPVATQVHTVLMALRTLGARRVSVITPYPEQSVKNLVNLMSAGGFDIVSAKGEDVTLAEVISQFDFDSSYAKTMESFAEHPDTDAIYISCPQWPVVGNIARIEAETGKAVVTHLSAVLWWAMATLGLKDPVPGYGRLLREMPGLFASRTNSALPAKGTHT